MVRRFCWFTFLVFNVALAFIVVALVWSGAAVAFALLAGGIIHARDHRDTPYGGFSGPRPVRIRTGASAGSSAR